MVRHTSRKGESAVQFCHGPLTTFISSPMSLYSSIQVPKDISLSKIPPNISMNVPFVIDNDLYVIEEINSYDMCVFVDCTHEIQKNYRVRQVFLEEQK